MLMLYRLRNHFLSIQKSNASEIVIVSRHLDAVSRGELLLFSFEQLSSKRKLNPATHFDLVRTNEVIVVDKLRNELPYTLATSLSKHLLHVLDAVQPFQNSEIEKTILQYGHLQLWGEPNSAKLIAEHEGISVRTVHSRLFQARQAGELAIPGRGQRTKPRL